MNVNNQRRAGVILGYANIIVKNLVNLLYTPMLLAFVGQGDYGVFQTANSFIFSLTLLSFGFSGAYVRFYTQRKASADELGIRVLNGMYLLLYLAICVVVISVGLIISANVDIIFASSFTVEEVDLAGTLMALMSFNVAVTLLSSVFDANIIVHEEFAFQQTRQMLTTLATPGLALLLLFCGFETVGVACAQLAVNTLLLVLNARFAYVRLKMRFDFLHFDTSLFRAIAAFSAWLFANQICDLVNQNVPNIILGAECGATVVAVFAVSIQIRNVFISLSTTISNVFVPEVNRLVAESDDNKRLTAIMTRVGRYQFALLLWVYGGFAILGRFFISRWAGDNFTDAYWMILAMVLPLIIPLAQNLGIEIQKAKNLHKARSMTYLIMALIGVIFTAVVAPMWGYWAAAIAYISSIIIGNCLFMNWYYHKRVGLDMFRYWKSVLPFIVSGCITTGTCMLVAHFIPVNDWMSFFGWGTAFTCLYGLVARLFGLGQSEKDEIAHRFTGMLHRR